jgi:hypothetical protein
LHSNRGDTSLIRFWFGLDPHAADKAGRVCRGVELDPFYVDVIIRRYETTTAKFAVLVETAETFEALAERRASEAAPV